MTQQNIKVPFLDLQTQYRELKTEIDSAITEVLETSGFILGPEVAKFEKNFAQFNEVGFSIGVANGTDSLRLAYEALGIGAGDEVIIPAHTFVATAIGVMEVGATPVLVDIDPNSFLIDYEKLEAAVTSRTKAICPVHLYGRVCDMDTVMGFASKHGLRVVEDTAQAHGARWKGKRAGTFGAFGSFSFYPGKNLGAYGDGGALVTASETLASTVRKLRNYGSEIKYQHPFKGINSRLDGVQAAVLNVKLKHLEGWNQKRWEAAKRYNQLLEAFAGDGLVLPELCTQAEHVFHLYVIRVQNRDQVLKSLGDLGVSAGIHYPSPFHLQGGYESLGYKQGAFPITEKISGEILSLPMFPEITEEQQQHVVAALLKSLKLTEERRPNSAAAA